MQADRKALLQSGLDLLDTFHWSVFPACGLHPLSGYEPFQSRLPTKQELQDAFARSEEITGVGAFCGEVSHGLMVGMFHGEAGRHVFTEVFRRELKRRGTKDLHLFRTFEAGGWIRNFGTTPQRYAEDVQVIVLSPNEIEWHVGACCFIVFPPSIVSVKGKPVRLKWSRPEAFLHGRDN